MTPGMTAAIKSVAVFAFAMLLAISCGSLAILQSGGGMMMALANPVGWVIGFVATIAVFYAPKLSKSGEVVLAATIILLTATLFDAGLLEVHRWVELGPLRVNVAALVIPAFIAILAAGKVQQSIVAFSWLAAMSLLAAQPDASQATALAIAGPFLFASWPVKRRWPILVSTIILAIISWLKPDPLLPVAEVEGIFGLMWEISPVLMVLGLAALSATIFAIQQLCLPVAALTAYCAAIAVTPALGHFPVPLIGFGISFPLGWWLGIAITLRNRQTA